MAGRRKDCRDIDRGEDGGRRKEGVEKRISVHLPFLGQQSTIDHTRSLSPRSQPVRRTAAAHKQCDDRYSAVSVLVQQVVLGRAVKRKSGEWC